MIRSHGAVHPTSVYAGITRAHDTGVYPIWRMGAPMKKYGIHSFVSFYWAGFINRVPAGWGIDGYSGTCNQPWEGRYFDHKLKNTSIFTGLPSQGRMSLHHIWDVTQTGHSQGKDALLGDHVHFPADVQSSFSACQWVIIL